MGIVIVGKNPNSKRESMYVFTFGWLDFVRSMLMSPDIKIGLLFAILLFVSKTASVKCFISPFGCL